MKIVGLTGGIGSGKTTVSKVFSLLGIPVYDSDYEAKRIMNTNKTVIKKFKNKFGNGIYCKSGLNREKMAKLIFENRTNIEYVNSIVHPEVMIHFKDWEKNQNSIYIIIETAILFERGIHKDVDLKITVTASDDIKIKRIIDRDGLTEIDIRARMSNQMSDEVKAKQSDYIVINDNNHLILPQILKIHNDIIKKA